MKKEGRLWGLEALRCLAFIAVMISHAGYDELNEYGAWGVSVFFVLSGFLLSYNYVDSGRIKEVSFKSNLKFMIKRISRLYLLHVVCTFLMLPFCFLGSHSENGIFVIFKLLLNLMMIQEWFPFAYNSINDVSWFLCSICFGYFMFPWFCRRLEKRNKSADGVLKIIAGLLVFQVAASFLINLLFGGMHFDGIFVDNPVYWFLYNHPLMRFIEIAIGYYLGYYYLYSRKEIDTKICSFMEIVMLIIVLGNGIFLNWYFTWSFEETWWWTCAVVYTFQVCVTVYVFALGRGIISRIMCNPLTKLVSSISSDAFLIHYVVFDYLTTIVYLLSGREFEIVFGPLINLTLGVVLTMMCSVIWKYLLKWVNDNIEFKITI